MIKLNFYNIDEIIFLNSEIRNKFSDLKYIIDQWDIGYKFAGLHFVKQRAKLDMLNALQETHIDVLTKIYNDAIIIDRIDYKIIKNFSFELDDELDLPTNSNNFCITRNKNKFSITFWR